MKKLLNLGTVGTMLELSRLKNVLKSDFFVTYLGFVLSKDSKYVTALSKEFLLSKFLAKFTYLGFSSFCLSFC